MEEKPFDTISVAMCPAHDMKHRCLSGIARKLENENWKKAIEFQNLSNAIL